MLAASIPIPKLAKSFGLRRSSSRTASDRIAPTLEVASKSWFLLSILSGGHPLEGTGNGCPLLATHRLEVPRADDRANNPPSDGPHCGLRS